MLKYACPRCGGTTIGPNRKAHPDLPPHDGWLVPLGMCSGAADCLEMPQDEYDALIRDEDTYEHDRDAEEQRAIDRSTDGRDHW